MTQVNTVILHSIERLKVEPNALSFDQPTNLIILEVGGLEGREGENIKPAFSSNIHNLAIVNSTMINLNSNLFSKKLRPFQFHLVGSVLSSRLPTSSQDQGDLFNFESQLTKIVINRCNVTNSLNSNFIKATAIHVEVKTDLLNAKNPKFW